MSQLSTAIQKFQAQQTEFHAELASIKELGYEVLILISVGASDEIVKKKFNEATVRGEELNKQQEQLIKQMKDLLILIS